MLNIEPHVLAGQVCWQAWSIDLRSGPGGFPRTGRKPGFGPRKIGFQIFKAELQLIALEPFGTPSKLVTLELLHDEPQPLDLRLRLGESGALDRKRAHHPLQRFHIVRQGGKIDVHKRRISADSRTPHRTTYLYESISRSV